MSAMSRTQRAMQLWSVLVLAARNQQVLSYSMVEKLTGLPKWTQADFLGVVAAYCIVNKLPPLTVLVVNEETGLPGGKFPGPADIFGGQARVFVYDWFAHGIPSPEDFEAASERISAAKTSA
jgi:hypothetical protein